jgi:16S rRNA (guanine527-N7)-methyltransferase
MQIIQKYFSSLTPLQVKQFSELGPLYELWNQRINVISRKDIENLYEHHVLHSLAIAGIISFKPGTRIIDAGTGGGFPGIPLAILFPESQFILVDSIAKKIKVADTIIKETGLLNCTAKNLRLEDLRDKADFVVCRAVTDIPRLFGWVGKNITPGGINDLPNGLLALKGGDLEEEILPMGFGVKVFNIRDHFSEEYFETKKVVYIPQVKTNIKIK